MGIVSELLQFCLMIYCAFGYLECLYPEKQKNQISLPSTSINFAGIKGDAYKKAPWASINIACMKQEINNLDALYAARSFDLNKKMGARKITLLHEAIENKKYQTAIWFLKKGADVSVADRDKKSCWDRFVARREKYDAAPPQKALSDSFLFYFQSFLAGNEAEQKAEYMRLMIRRGKDSL